MNYNLSMAADLFGHEEDQPMAEDDKQPRQRQSKPGKADLAAGAAGSGGGLRFEDAYNRLDELVGEMESDELPLEDLLARFEEGVKLVRHCQGFLKQAQLRIEKFVEQKDGRWVLKELDE